MDNRVTLSVGIGLLSLLGGLYYVGNMEKQDVQQADPSIEAADKAANIANIANMQTARALYLQSKGKQPDSLQDLVPEFMGSVPNEAFSKSNATAKSYDGSGGWVLSDDGIQPNFPQELSPSAAPH